MVLVQYACIALVLISTFGNQRSDKSVEWLTGNKLNRQTLAANSGQWADVPLRTLLRQLSAGQGIPIFVDRRVDPSTKITLSARDLTWEQLLFEIGRTHRYGFCRLEGIYYFGPADVAVCLHSNFQELKSWINKNKRDADVNWRRPVSATWGRLSQPRQIVEQLSQAHGFDVLEIEQINFDIWPQFDGPDLPLVLKTALLTVGFDKWIAVSKSGKKMKLIPYPKPKNVQYSIANLADSKKVRAELKKDFPNLDFLVTGKSGLAISGSPENLWPAVGEALSQQTSTKDQSTIRTFTAELKGQRGSILASMAQQLAVELEFADSIRDVLSEHVEFEVSDATADEIIIKTLAGTGLNYTIRKNNLTIHK